MLHQRVPLAFFVRAQIVTYPHYCVLDFLDTSIFVALLRARFGPQYVRELLLSSVLDEVPNGWWPHCVQLFPLLGIIDSLLIVLVGALLLQFLFTYDPLHLVIVDQLLDLRFADSFEDLEQDEVLDVLDDLRVDVLQGLCSVEPQRLVFLVEVSVPDPVSSELLPLSLLKALLLLLISQVEEVNIFLIGHSLEVEFLLSHEQWILLLDDLFDFFFLLLFAFSW